MVPGSPRNHCPPRQNSAKSRVQTRHPFVFAEPCSAELWPAPALPEPVRRLRAVAGGCFEWVRKRRVEQQGRVQAGLESARKQQKGVKSRGLQRGGAET